MVTTVIGLLEAALHDANSSNCMTQRLSETLLSLLHYRNLGPGQYCNPSVPALTFGSRRILLFFTTLALPGPEGSIGRARGCDAMELSLRQ